MRGNNRSQRTRCLGQLPFLTVVALTLAVNSVPTNGHEVLRVAAYNTFNNPDNPTEDAVMATIFDAIGTFSNGPVTDRVAVVAASESDTGSAARLTNVLNSLYGVSTYQEITSSSVGGDMTALIYDTDKLALLTSGEIKNEVTHPIVHATFRPNGTSGESDLYVYAIHLKSGSSSSDKTARGNETAVIRMHADSLGPDENVIFAGDFNIHGHSEDAVTNLQAAGHGQAYDVVDSPGEWRDNAEFKHVHTQNPRSDMDDRFDFHFVTSELIDGVGLDYLPESFHVLGNNGTHILGGHISSGTGASTEVLSALVAASDHLPVFADYYDIASHLGDANLDHIVDVSDLGILGGHFGTNGTTLLEGDFNGDGLVDVTDLGILGANWTASQSTGNVSVLVPEPTTLSLLAMSVLVVGRK